MRLWFLLILVFFTHLSFSQLQFADVSVAKGVNVNYGFSVYGAGVSFVDFDDDGWDDLTLTTDGNQPIIFLQNNSGTFSQVTFTGIDIQSEAKQVLWVDYDNDGDKDFFVTSNVGLNKLYKNDGSFVFTDVTDSSGLFTTDLFSYGATFGDIDNDGDLDLLICNREGDSSGYNYLYRNDNGVFTDITTSSGITTNVDLTFLASFFDYDNDGDQDLYVINDKDDSNILYQNDGSGQFTDVSSTSDAGIVIDAMSCTIGDYNADGWFDVYVTNTEMGNYLLQNDGDGTFTNKASDAGVEFLSTGWGAAFLDADFDSNVDLYVSGSLDGSVGGFLSAAFYHNDGDDTFTIPNNIGFENDTRHSYGNAIGDINNDGKPDIVVMNNNDNYFLWENQTATSGNWIKIKLEGVTSNKDGIGNKIEVHANGKSQYRYTVCGEGYLGQNSQYEFVGVGSATNIDYIKVTWNKTGIVETINNIQPNQAVRIQEGNGILNTTTESLLNFSVYPNPSKDGIYNISSLDSDMKVEVFDLSGRRVHLELLVAEYLDISELSQGIYVAKFSSGNRFKTIKLMRN